MFCIRCGVQMVDGQTQCPLCGTKMLLPDDMQPEEGLYPGGKYPAERKRQLWPQAILSTTFILPMLIVLICNLQMSHGITWSGYVIGALLVTYVITALPLWFRSPNPVIFTPCGFVAAGLYLHYINYVTNGNWFLSFAFPVVGGLGLIVTAVVTLLKYVRRGKLYIFGGAMIALGMFMLLIEFLVIWTFESVPFIGWSLYPLVVLVLLGGLLIFIAICRPARDLFERKTFI